MLSNIFSGVMSVNVNGLYNKVVDHSKELRFAFNNCINHAGRMSTDKTVKHHTLYNISKRHYIRLLKAFKPEDAQTTAWIAYQEWLLERRLCPKFLDCNIYGEYKNSPIETGRWAWVYDPIFEQTPKPKIKSKKRKKLFDFHITKSLMDAVIIVERPTVENYKKFREEYYTRYTYEMECIASDYAQILISWRYFYAELNLFRVYQYEEASDIELAMLKTAIERRANIVTLV